MKTITKETTYTDEFEEEFEAEITMEIDEDGSFSFYNARHYDSKSQSWIENETEYGWNNAPTKTIEDFFNVKIKDGKIITEKATVFGEEKKCGDTGYFYKSVDSNAAIYYRIGRKYAYITRDFSDKCGKEVKMSISHFNEISDSLQINKHQVWFAYETMVSHGEIINLNTGKSW